MNSDFVILIVAILYFSRLKWWPGIVVCGFFLVIALFGAVAS
jgi:hypothetical protein